MLDVDNMTPSVMSAVRFDRARGCLQDAKIVMAVDSDSSLRTAANRSYYCIFHAMRAVLALVNFDTQKHSSIISKFRHDYIKTDIFPAALSDIIRDAFEIRNDCDYDDFYIVSKDAIAMQIENAKTFLSAIEEYLTRTVPEFKDILATFK